MRSHKIGTALMAVLAAGLVPGAAPAQRYNNPYGEQSHMEGFFSGQASTGQAQAAMISANAAVIKAIGDAIASNVKALESLQSARGRRVENWVKATSNFYEKRKLYEAYQGLSAVERAKRDDLVRFSKTALGDRPGAARLDANGNVQWPELLLADEFAEPRSQIDYVFAQRNAQPTDAGSDLGQTARTALAQMRRHLRAQMQELSPPEYAAARRFLDSLALELSVGPRPETILKTAALPEAAPAPSKSGGK